MVPCTSAATVACVFSFLCCVCILHKHLLEKMFIITEKSASTNISTLGGITQLYNYDILELKPTLSYTTLSVLCVRQQHFALDCCGELFVQTFLSWEAVAALQSLMFYLVQQPRCCTSTWVFLPAQIGFRIITEKKNGGCKDWISNLSSVVTLCHAMF